MAENKNHRIIGKIIIQGTLTNTTPVLIGKGEGETTDVEIMRMPSGLPYIPASSITGCLQHQFITRKLAPGSSMQKKYEEQALRFWGSDKMTDENGEDIKTYQSHIIFDDLITTDPAAKDKIVIRDGVRIDPKKNIAENKGKYDYEILEPEVTFHLRAEVTLREGTIPGVFKKYVGFILSILQDDFRVGAHINTGFGKIKCEVKAWYFDFQGNVEQRDEWFNYLSELYAQPILNDKHFAIRPSPSVEIIAPEQLTPDTSTFTVSAAFKIKSALIIGSYGIKDEDADKTHLTSSGKDKDGKDIKNNVLSGKSIRGALRHRALKILNTLEIDRAEDKINDLFGYVVYKPGEKKDEAKKGRLRIEEEVVSGTKAQIQNRNKIDRFTGGTISSALFNSEPLWRIKDEKHLSINLSVTSISNGRFWEPALLLFLLKDLWMADLPIGGEKNVGRGVLVGVDAQISFNETKVHIVRKDGAMTDEPTIEGNIVDLAPLTADWENFIKDNRKQPE